MEYNISISVIIPVYNAEKYLDKCLESIINQSLKDIEIIFINDGSTDSSLKLLEKYRSKDNRIIIIDQKNLRQAAARNNGLKIAKGEYISFVDADDWIEDTFLEQMYNEAINNDADIVASNVKSFINNNYKPDEYVGYWTMYGSKNTLISAEDKFGIIYSCAIWNKIYRREFLMKNSIFFCEDLFLEDVTFNHVASILSNKIIVSNNTFYYYNRGNDNSFMHNAEISKKTLDMINMTKKTKELIKDKTISDYNVYSKILDSFEIYNLLGWLNQINKKYIEEYYELMRNSFKKIDIHNNNFILEEYLKLYNKVLENDTYVNFIYKNKQEYIMFNRLDNLKKEIDKYDVISFDIFDTLLLRPYATPQNVFQHLEAMYNAIGFSSIREVAEDNLRNYKNIEYADYDEIYSIIPSDFQFLKEKEVELETNTLYANLEIKDLFNYVKKLNKKIILVSDMYYSSEILDKILKNNGYEGYENIYISGQLKKAKYDKTLFEYVKEKLNIEYTKILHIGDNIHSDYNIPKSLGMNAFHYIKPLDQLFSLNNKLNILLNENIKDFTVGVIIGVLLKKFVYEGFSNNYWEYFGYYIGGPLCYGLTKFVYDEVVKENIKDIIFVARDGYTIQKIFNLIKKEYDIQSYYIYASRSINTVVSIEYKNTSNWKHRLDSCIQLLKYTSKEFEDKCPKQFNNDDEKIQFIKNNISLITNISNEVFESYKQYISNFNIKNNKLAIFDVSAGFFNSMKLLKKVFPHSDILGLYWLISSDEKDNFWCKAYQKDFRLYLASYEILELIITAPELPVKYLDKNGIFHLIDNEYERKRLNIYNNISNGEISFTKDLLSIFMNYPVNFYYLSIIKLVNTFINYADNIDMSNFADVKHGVNEAHTLYEQLITFNNYSNNNLINSYYYKYNISDILFSVANNDKYKIITILGIKITLKNKKYTIPYRYNILDILFSITDTDKYKIITILGIKITTRQDKTRQDKTRQDKTRQDIIRYYAYFLIIFYIYNYIKYKYKKDQSYLLNR